MVTSYFFFLQLRDTETEALHVFTDAGKNEVKRGDEKREREQIWIQGYNALEACKHCSAEYRVTSKVALEEGKWNG